LLTLIMEQGNLDALRSIVSFAVAKKDAGSLIEQAQRYGNTEMTAYLLDWQNKG
jgi:hypothetical protein